MQVVLKSNYMTWVKKNKVLSKRASVFSMQKIMKLPSAILSQPGQFRITCVRAIDLKYDDGFFGKSDVVVVFKFNDEVYVTDAGEGESSNPVWNEEFGFDVKKINFLNIEVISRPKIGLENIIGRSERIPTREWIRNGTFEGTINLMSLSGHVSVGNIEILVKFDPSAPLSMKSKSKLSRRNTLFDPKVLNFLYAIKS